MMTNKRRLGFTLIELLAVIAVIALILAIAAPEVLKRIEMARKETFKETAYGLIRAVQINYAEDFLNGSDDEIIFTYQNGVEYSSVPGKKLQYQGVKPQNGSIKINEDGQVSIAIHNGVYCAQKGYHESEVKVTKQAVEECSHKTITFARNFGGSDWDEFYNIFVVSDGYIAIGQSYSKDGDLSGLIPGNFIVKYDLNGNIVWKKEFKDSYSDDYFVYFDDIILVNDGYIAVGYVTVDWDVKNELLIIKYDSNGNVIWKKRLEEMKLMEEIILEILLK